MSVCGGFRHPFVYHSGILRKLPEVASCSGCAGRGKYGWKATTVLSVRLGRRARLEATIKINEERCGNIWTDTKLSANLDPYEVECDVGISRPIRANLTQPLLVWFGSLLSSIQSVACYSEVLIKPSRTCSFPSRALANFLHNVYLAYSNKGISHKKIN